MKEETYKEIKNRLYRAHTDKDGTALSEAYPLLLSDHGPGDRGPGDVTLMLAPCWLIYYELPDLR
jgi:hypothetical protein